MTPSDEDRVFNWAESNFPNNFLPKNPATATAQGYVYRYYAASGEYLGIEDGKVWYLKPGGGPSPLDVGAPTQHLQSARQARY